LLLTESVFAAVSLLYAGWLQSRATNRTRWDFAVSGEVLVGQGVTESELTVLIERGYAERRSRSLGRRARLHGARFSLGQRPQLGQFALMDVGAAWVEVQWGALGMPANPPAISRPTWDGPRRVLRWGQEIVKRFLQPAGAQVCLLTAFEEQHWMHRIDDPLPQIAGMSPKQRLHDTIKSLNRHHRVQAVVFHGDGTGQGVCWRQIDGA
jgi:hypothetical protein